MWPAVEGGGPAGTLPPHDWKVLFKNGGIGTLWPLYYALVQRARRADAAARQAELGAVQQEMQKMANTAFVGEGRGPGWGEGLGKGRGTGRGKVQGKGRGAGLEGVGSVCGVAVGV